MVDSANVVEIKSVVTQLINPHRAHLARERGDSLAWEWFLKQLGGGDHSEKLIHWVCAHPMYLIEAHSDSFQKRAVVLGELLQRENLNREDFIRYWIQADSSPRFSLLQQLEHQRHNLQVAGMMWFNPVISVAYDYQELFQSFCDFLRVVGALIDGTHDLPSASEGVIEGVSQALWSSPIKVQLFPGCSAKHDAAPVLAELLNSRCQFTRLIRRSIKLRASALVDDSDLGASLQREADASSHWLEVMRKQIVTAVAHWLSPMSREDTRLGIRTIQDIYGDLPTYLSYRLIDTSLREGLCL